MHEFTLKRQYHDMGVALSAHVWGEPMQSLISAHHNWYGVVLMLSTIMHMMEGDKKINLFVLVSLYSS